jgi:hypothetical protein
MRWMEACYGGTDVMERPCAVARGIDINNTTSPIHPHPKQIGGRVANGMQMHLHLPHQ